MVYKNKSNGFYYYDFMLNGIRHSKSTRTKYKRLAQEIEDAARSEVLRSGYLPKRFGENKRFFDLCEKYFLEVPEKSKKVIESNLNVLKRYFEDRLLSEITPSLVSKFKEDLKAKDLSVARINHLLQTLKRMFKVATDQWEWLPHNPLRGVTLLRGANKRIRVLSDEEEAVLLPACPSWLRELIQFDLLSGFRVAECLSIQAKDIDLFSKRLTCWPPWRRDYDREVARLIEPYPFDLGMLAGFMLIFTDVICERRPLLNLHPAAPGGPVGIWQDVIWELVAGRADRSGITIFLCTRELDRGPTVTYCTYPLRGPTLDPLWRQVEARSVDEIKAAQGEENPLFKGIRRQGATRELPLIVATLRAFADERLRFEGLRVVTADGQPVHGYDLTPEVEAAAPLLAESGV